MRRGRGNNEHITRMVFLLSGFPADLSNLNDLFSSGGSPSLISAFPSQVSPSQPVLLIKTARLDPLAESEIYSWTSGGNCFN